MRRGLRAAAVLAALVLAAPARAEVKPHGLFTDNMVLQRDTECPVWGTAEAGEDVSVSLGKTGEDKGIGVRTKADADGKWKVSLPGQKAGGPYTLIIGGKEKKVTLKNVYFGEVWVCSGQSNMEQSLATTADARKVIENSKNPMIRLYTVRHRNEKMPVGDVRGTGWQECDPKSVGHFSAVAYYFGRDLQKKLNVPIGLIHSSVGGTPAEAWTPRPAMEADPQLKGLAARGSSLYNGMIAPLQPFAIKGVIWYQGESNAGAAYQYRTLFPTMIRAWREAWKEGNFPFLFVQLAPWMAIVDKPQESAWAELREAQLLTSQKVPNTAMAVITDAGDPRDIHPKRKEPVGARLALAARALAYGEKIVYSGPLYDKIKVEGNKAVLSFKDVGKGLEAKGGELTGFTIAGEDRKFHNARAKIENNTVVVWSDDVAKPVAVRYGWANCPVVNLWNKDGLPASPFRTDDFPMVTGPKKK
jgi:sialate O-acetylesterase